MKKIIVIGDSLTFGLLPLSSKVLESSKTWPSIMKQKIISHYNNSDEIFVFIDSAPGRTILQPLISFGFEQDNALSRISAIHNHNPNVDLLILLLGSNDYLGYEAYQKLNNKQCLIYDKIMVDLKIFLEQFRQTYAGSNFKVLLLVPPIINAKSGVILNNFGEAFTKCFKNTNGTYIFNLQPFIKPDLEDNKNSDGIHLTAPQVEKLGLLVSDFIIANHLIN